MYGLFGKFETVPGQRPTVLKMFQEDSASMPGCLLYVVNSDPNDPNGIWIYEAWESKEAHDASLQLESVQKLIARVTRLIAGMGSRTELTPEFGLGLPTDK